MSSGDMNMRGDDPPCIRVDLARSLLDLPPCRQLNELVAASVHLGSGSFGHAYLYDGVVYKLVPVHIADATTTQRRNTVRAVIDDYIERRKQLDPRSLMPDAVQRALLYSLGGALSGIRNIDQPLPIGASVRIPDTPTFECGERNNCGLLMTEYLFGLINNVLVRTGTLKNAPVLHGLSLCSPGAYEDDGDDATAVFRSDFGGTTLRTVLSNHPSESDLRNMLFQCIFVLATYREIGLVHNDTKDDNWLVEFVEDHREDYEYVYKGTTYVISGKLLVRPIDFGYTYKYETELAPYAVTPEWTAHDIPYVYSSPDRNGDMQQLLYSIYLLLERIGDAPMAEIPLDILRRLMPGHITNRVDVERVFIPEYARVRSKNLLLGIDAIDYKSLLDAVYIPSRQRRPVKRMGDI